jgi:hypothetical protein
MLVGIYNQDTERERERECERWGLGVRRRYRVALSLLPYSCQALWGPHFFAVFLTTVLAFLCASLIHLQISHFFIN